MIAYLDASVLVSLVAEDGHLARVEAWLINPPEMRLSGWALAEASSALSLAFRSGRLTPAAWSGAEAKLDEWADQVPLLTITQSDFRKARLLVRGHSNLRAPDALHLAIAQRHGFALATFDQKLAVAARAEQVELAPI